MWLCHPSERWADVRDIDGCGQRAGLTAAFEFQVGITKMYLDEAEADIGARQHDKPGDAERHQLLDDA